MRMDTCAPCDVVHRCTQAFLLSKCHTISQHTRKRNFFTPMRKMVFPEHIFAILTNAEHRYVQTFYTEFNLNRTVSVESAHLSTLWGSVVVKTLVTAKRSKYGQKFDYAGFKETSQQFPVSIFFFRKNPIKTQKIRKKFRYARKQRTTVIAPICIKHAIPQRNDVDRFCSVFTLIGQ